VPHGEAAFCQQHLPNLVDSRVIVIRAIGAIDTGEDRLQL
jgi:hypothetical protein